MNAKRHISFLVAAIFPLIVCTQAQEQTQPPSSQSQAILVYGLVVDNSSSLRTQLSEVVEAGKSRKDQDSSGLQFRSDGFCRGLG